MDKSSISALNFQFCTFNSGWSSPASMCTYIPITSLNSIFPYRRYPWVRSQIDAKGLLDLWTTSGVLALFVVSGKGSESARFEA